MQKGIIGMDERFVIWTEVLYCTTTFCSLSVEMWETLVGWDMFIWLFSDSQLPTSTRLPVHHSNLNWIQPQRIHIWEAIIHHLTWNVDVVKYVPLRIIIVIQYLFSFGLKADYIVVQEGGKSCWRTNKSTVRKVPSIEWRSHAFFFFQGKLNYINLRRLKPYCAFLRYFKLKMHFGRMSYAWRIPVILTVALDISSDHWRDKNALPVVHFPTLPCGIVSAYTSRQSCKRLYFHLVSQSQILEPLIQATVIFTKYRSFPSSNSLCGRLSIFNRYF